MTSMGDFRTNGSLTPHVADIVKDITKTSAVLSKILAPLGIGPWNITKFSPDEIVIGEPWTNSVALATLEDYLGPVQLELIQQEEGKWLWNEFLEAHGQAWHHVSITVPNWDEVISQFTKYGGKVFFQIRVGAKRFAYVNIEGLNFEIAEP